MNRQRHRAVSEPITGKVYWRVAEMARKRGLVSHRGRTPGKPHLQAIMRATGLSYEAVYKLLRRPSRIQRVDLATLERLCALFQCAPGDLLGIDRRYPPHPRAHTASVNPLADDLRRDWPTRFAERLTAHPIYDRPDEYVLPSELAEQERVESEEAEAPSTDEVFHLDDHRPDDTYYLPSELDRPDMDDELDERDDASKGRFPWDDFDPAEWVRPDELG